MTAPARQALAGNEQEAFPSGATCAARAASDKLGVDTVVMAMGDLLGVTEAFVVTAGRNSRQVRTLVDEIEREVKENFSLAPFSVEGLRDLQWVLMDYGDFIVHVFDEDTRRYYDLERLWADAPRVAWGTEDQDRDA